MIDQNLRTTIWKNLANIKFQSIYACEFSRLVDNVDRVISAFLAIATAASIATWTLWQYVPIWGIVIGLSQFLYIIKPYLPYLKQVNDYIEVSVAYDQLYLEYERFWRTVDSSDNDIEIENQFYNLREKEYKLKSIYKNIHAPKIEKLANKVQTDTYHSLDLQFST